MQPSCGLNVRSARWVEPKNGVEASRKRLMPGAAAVPWSSVDAISGEVSRSARRVPRAVSAKRRSAGAPGRRSLTRPWSPLSERSKRLSVAVVVVNVAGALSSATCWARVWAATLSLGRYGVFRWDAAAAAARSCTPS